MSRQVALTGANGFIGQHLLTALGDQGRSARAICRARPSGAADWRPVDLALASDSDLDGLLDGVSTCYHLAGIAHRTASPEALSAFNVDLTARLYQAAGRCGVERFVWLSSAKALAERSAVPIAVTADPAPADDYGRSKAAAERRLLALSKPRAGQPPAGDPPARVPALIVIRPPLVYGPGVRANFRALLRLADSGWPLPLAAARAPRSLIGVRNLCDALLAAGSAPAGLYQVADAQPQSVASLLTAMRRSLQRAPRLWRCPPPLLGALLALLGRRGVYRRLFEPLLLDTADSQARLGWVPRHCFATQLEETVRWFRNLR